MLPTSATFCATARALAAKNAPSDQLHAQWVVEGCSRRLQLVRGNGTIGSVLIDDAAKATLQVSDLVVASGWRRRGYGSLLLAHAIHLGARLQRQWLILVCVDSGTGRLRSWYLRQGFVPIGVTRCGRALMQTAVSPSRWPLMLPSTTQGGTDEKSEQAELSGQLENQRRDL